MTLEIHYFLSSTVINYSVVKCDFKLIFKLLNFNNKNSI